MLASEKSELTYKQLSDNVNCIIATIIHVLILMLAILIPKVDIVFEFAGGIACPSIFFIFPALGYLQTLSQFGTEAKRSESSTKIFVVVSWVFLIVGVAEVCGYLTFLSLKVSGFVKTSD